MQPAQQRDRSVFPDARLPKSTTRTRQQVGDRAGEHLRTRRGRYSAWVYVVIAFLLQIGVVDTVVVAAFAPVRRALHLDSDGFDLVTLAVLAVAVAGAVATFWNRWRVIEAVASRFCCGIMNVSLCYVPFVALAYANYRAFLKLRRE